MEDESRLYNLANKVIDIKTDKLFNTSALRDVSKDSLDEDVGEELRIDDIPK